MGLSDYFRELGLFPFWQQQDYRPELLMFASDISGGDPGVVDPLNAALAGTHNHAANTQLWFEWEVFRVLENARWLLHCDWREAADNFVPAADRLLRKITGAGIDPADETMLRGAAESARQARWLKLDINALYGPLSELLEMRQLRFLNINRGGDDYSFVMVAPQVYRRWAGTAFSRGFVVENPGWQFAKELEGTPYARFSHRRTLRRPRGDA